MYYKVLVVLASLTGCLNNTKTHRPINKSWICWVLLVEMTSLKSSMAPVNRQNITVPS